jgi:chromosome segregation ATPase
MPRSHYYKQSIVSDLQRNLEETSRFLNEQTEKVKNTNELGKQMKTQTVNISEKLKAEEKSLKAKKEFAKKKQAEVKTLSNEIAGLSKTIQRINDRFSSFSKDLGKDLENAKKKLEQEINKSKTLITEIKETLGVAGADDLLKELVINIQTTTEKAKNTENNIKETEKIADELKKEEPESEELPAGFDIITNRIRRRSRYTKRKSMKRKSRSMKRKSRSMKRRSYKKRSMSRRRRY